VAPDETADVPGCDTGAGWVCVRGTVYSGTLCELRPSPSKECLPGDKRWCDGVVYDGWGLQVCSPAGEWGQCQEETGQRPNTLCACYFFYTDFRCCERPDCVVPAGTNGRLCPPSGGRLCDYCDPDKQECRDPGARCVVYTSSHESFCGQPCSATQPCPAGYTCTPVGPASDKSEQCVPADKSCAF
jgi:hypothetical protein